MVEFFVDHYNRLYLFSIYEQTSQSYQSKVSFWDFDQVLLKVKDDYGQILGNLYVNILSEERPNCILQSLSFDKNLDLGLLLICLDGEYLIDDMQIIFLSDSSLFQLLAKQSTIRSGLSFYANGEPVLQINQNTPLPVINIISLITVLEYAKQVTLNHTVDPDHWVNLNSSVDVYYAPQIDFGHQSWLKDMHKQKKIVNDSA